MSGNVDAMEAEFTESPPDVMSGNCTRKLGQLLKSEKPMLGQLLRDVLSDCLFLKTALQ